MWINFYLFYIFYNMGYNVISEIDTAYTSDRLGKN